MKKLSNDDLLLTQILDENGKYTNSYKVTVQTEKNGLFTDGTALIREIIRNEEYTCEITLDNSHGSKEEPESDIDAINGVGTNSHIYFNNINPVYVHTRNSETNQVYYEPIPKHIELSHEMFHSLGSMTGTKISNSETGAYAYTTTKGDVINTYISQEELETMGISYYPGIKYIGTPVNAWNYNMTENSIRDEQGLNRRISY